MYREMLSTFRRRRWPHLAHFDWATLWSESQATPELARAAAQAEGVASDSHDTGSERPRRARAT